MATFRPLVMGGRPTVVEMPRWLYSDHVVGGASDRLQRAAGPEMLVVSDRSRLVGVLHAGAFADPGTEAAHAALVDELTVWRLSTDDGARSARTGVGGTCNTAHVARHFARRAGVAA